MDTESLNITAWQLKYLAQALTRAKRLEAMRMAFHEELYDCISFPTSNFDPLNPKSIKTATDSQAIRIIELKERYDRTIMNEYGRHVQWTLLLEWLSEKDQLIMIRYFQKKKYVHPELIASLLQRIHSKVEEEESYIEKARDDLAKEEHAEYRSVKAEKRLPKRKLSIFEDGKWILIDPDEYKIQQWQKQRDREREELQKYFKETKRHSEAL